MKKFFVTYILVLFAAASTIFAQGANDVAWWVPEEPSPGVDITIFYADSVNARLTGDAILHWGINGRPGAWTEPPESIWPPNTVARGDGQAVQTPMNRVTGAQHLWELTISTNDSIRNLLFVFTDGVNWDSPGDWIIDFTGTPPPERTDTVSVEVKVDLAASITNRGFAFGDTARVQMGFNNTAAQVIELQLARQGFSTIYSGNTTVVTTIGDTLDYNYFNVKNNRSTLEVYFNFGFPDPSNSRAQRRQAIVSGRTTTLVDTAASNVSAHRQPFFRNQSVIARDVLVTLECDVRPAIYQLLGSTAVLDDIQGSLNVGDPDSALMLGVAVNGPITGSWSNDAGPDWGAHLMTLPNKVMYDDGTHGDAVAGDSIFTTQFQFHKDSSDVIGQEFKFGIGGGDNEGGFGNNHVANIDDSQPTAIIKAQFGSIDPTFYDQWDFDKRKPSGIPSKVENAPLPSGFALEQNYPNPFNPVTLIQYSIANKEHVRLSVFNVLGEEIASLIDIDQPAGSYNVNWDGRDHFGRQVGSGLYFYRIEAGDFARTRKMMLMR